MRKRSRAVTVVTGVTMAIGLTATAAWADYYADGHVTSRTYVGSSGVGAIYKSHTISVDGGTQICVRASSNSGNDPTDASPGLSRGGSLIAC